MIPTLHTARLTLRPQIMADFPAFAAFLASAHAKYMGGPNDGSQAWDWFASDQAQWSLLGWGGLSVVESASGRLVGQVKVIRPPAFPETELGWIAYDEGQGYMTEAAQALIGWAFGPRGLVTLVSYVNRANARAIRLAERLGALPDAGAATPDDIECLTYRFTNRGQHVSP